MGRQDDANGQHRVIESDDDDSADGDANLMTRKTVPAPMTTSAKRTLSSPLTMDVPAGRFVSEGIFIRIPQKNGGWAPAGAHPTNRRSENGSHRSCKKKPENKNKAEVVVAGPIATTTATNHPEGLLQPFKPCHRVLKVPPSS